MNIIAIHPGSMVPSHDDCHAVEEWLEVGSVGGWPSIDQIDLVSVL
jgi:hypothetical protein